MIYIMTNDLYLCLLFYDCVFPISLSYLLENCEPRINQSPLLEATLQLQEPYLVLTPSAEELRALSDTLIRDIMNISVFVPRLSLNEYNSYLVIYSS